MKRSSIVMFLVSHGMSGIETLALSKARWYRQRGFDVLLAAPFRNDLHAQYLASGSHIHYSYFPSGRAISRSRDDHVARFVLDVEKRMQSLGLSSTPTFVEAFNPVGALMAEYASLRWSTPAVTGVFSTFGYDPHTLGARSWSGLVQNYTSRQAIYAMNRTCADALARTSGNDPDKLPLFPLPLNEVPGVHHARDGGSSLLSVGRLAPVKQYNLYMLDVVSQLRDEFPNLSYTIIGTGELVPRVRTRIEELNIGDAVRMLPEWPHERLGELARQHDLFVGTGYSALEMAMAGLPALLAPRAENGAIPMTPGFADEGPGLSVGEVTGPAARPIEDVIRDFLRLSGDERRAVSRRVRANVRAKFELDSVMSAFVDFATRARVAQTRSEFAPSEFALPASVTDRIAAAFRNRSYRLWLVYRSASRWGRQ